MRKTSFLLLVLALFFISSKVYAGWVISEETTDSFGNKSYQTIFIQGDMIRFETPISISIFNLKQQKITLIFAQHQAYWQGTARELRKQIFEMANRQMQELIQHSPAYQQDTLRKLYKNSMRNQDSANDTLPVPPEISILKTGKSKTILGHLARLYEIHKDTLVLEKIWVSDKINPFSKLNLSNMIALTRVIDPFSAGPYGFRSKEYIKLFYHGLVLKRIRFLPNGTEQISTVKKIRNIKINEAIFEIPAEYHQSNIQQIMLMDLNNNILHPQSLSPVQDQGIPDFLPPLPIKR